MKLFNIFRSKKNLPAPAVIPDYREKDKQLFEKAGYPIAGLPELEDHPTNAYLDL